MDEEQQKRPAEIGGFTANLETLSIAELERRIVMLEAEIERTRVEIARKRSHAEAAASFFKSS